jgi:CubicO group peptidase (beta-lactamase class C family)
MKKNILIAVAFTSTLVLLAQDKNKKMEELVTAYAEQGKFNGNVVVTQKGAVVYEGSFGLRDAENKIPHQANDIFLIGSVTKQITSAVIMQLQEEGKLSVTDKLSKYFTGFPNGDKITIENLLTHTAGIHNYTDDEKIMKGDLTKHFSQQEMLAILKSYKPDFEPGAKWNYSNSGYSILGYIIEKVTGKPYETVVRQRIFTPLHMTTSGFDFADLSSPNKSKGYFSLADNKITPAPILDSSLPFSAGAVYTTLNDLAKWERAITTGKLIKPASWNKVFTPYKNKYGYGWGIDSLYGKLMTTHGGGIPGFSSYIMRFPKEEVAIIAFDNASGRQLALISNGLAAIMFDQSINKPSAHKEVTIDSSILQQYVGEYQLAPTFSITVTEEGNNLKAQATGQPQFDIYAEKEAFFFLKVVDAQIEFVKDESGKVTELILHQNGAHQKGKKIK